MFSNAAAGMFALVFGAEPKSLLPDRQEVIELSSVDAESLLVAFLSELLWYFDTHLLVPTKYGLSIEKTAAEDSPEEENRNQEPDEIMLKGEVSFVNLPGTGLSPLTDLKAVTMHNLQIKREKSGLSARVIFDI